MHNEIALHQLTDAQTVPEQQLPTSTSQLFFFQHDIIWHGTSLWPVWVICPGVSPPSFLCTSSLITGEAVGEAQKSLNQCKQFSATTEKCVYYHHYFSHKSKTQLIPDTMKKINPILTETRKILRSNYRWEYLLSSKQFI